MDRNSQSLINVGYNTGPVMWAGQKKNLEEQITGPMNSANIMATDITKLLEYLNRHSEYTDKFAAAYPGEAIGMNTIGKAIANYERSIVSQNSPFDRWLAGEQQAMSAQQKEDCVCLPMKNALIASLATLLHILQIMAFIILGWPQKTSADINFTRCRY